MVGREIALAAAGSIGCLVAVIHGILIERLMVGPVGRLAAAEPAMAPALSRLVAPLFQFSTFAWFAGGLALIASALWLGREAQAALGVLVGSLYLFGAVANLWATRGFHPGWMLMAAALALIAVALGGVLE